MIWELHLIVYGFRKSRRGGEKRRQAPQKQPCRLLTAKELSLTPGNASQPVWLAGLQQTLMKFWGICPVLCANESLKKY